MTIEEAIQELTQDVENVREKSFLKTALRSHLSRTYGFSHTEITDALSAFFVS
jgi:hypothetical protein